MKLLNELIDNIKPLEIIGLIDIPIEDIASDSRKVVKNGLFIAIKGINSDGHSFIEEVIQKGAKAIVCSKMPVTIAKDVTYIVVEDTQEIYGQIVSNYYGNPSSKLKLIGITGTNGKTTTATLLYQLVRKLGKKAGLLSTVVNKIEDEVFAATHTTPEPIALNSLLAKMVEAGCDYCFMEVSSHAVEQRRISGLSFTGGVFTNITHDHLDYHKTFENYLKAKKRFFDELSTDAFALSNKDDRNGEVMLQNTQAKRYYYSLKSNSTFKTKVIENHFDGQLLNIDDYEVWCNLIGEFNAYNMTAIYATAVLLGFEKIDILKELSLLKAVEGRFQTIKSANGITAIVDYAHTPDALKNVIDTINSIKKGNERLITVFGCGGDRDAAKRPVMGKIASELSEQVIITSDNPRSEEPGEIINQIFSGVNMMHKKKVLCIENRKEAIKTACLLAKQGDVILVAGKGHEKYQEIKGQRFHFDDFEEVSKMFNELSK